MECWNLDRVSYGNTIHELCTRPDHHIALHQEATSAKVVNTCASLGIAESCTGDRHLSAHAGGTGIKAIRPLFELDKLTYPGLMWHSFIARPWIPDDAISPEGISRNRIALIYEACDICTFHPQTGTPLERGGKAI